MLGLVIPPILAQALRQSPIMSNGNYFIFFNRPIAASSLLVSIGELTLAATSFVPKRKDWLDQLAEAKAGEVES